MGRIFLLIVTLITPVALAAEGASQYLRKGDEFFKSEQAKGIVTNVLSWQSPLGGWPKNVDTTAKRYDGKADDLKPTFDNGATTDELRLLARVRQVTGDKALDEPISRGVDYIVKAQYPSGGWPQFYPPPTSYHRHITFNDNAMVRLMEFLRETWSSERFAFLGEQRHKSARDAFDKGVACILKCQIRVDGKPTVWCAQHDETDFSPAKARAYELPSFSGAESVGIVRLLMSLEKPTPSVSAAIEGAVAWFEQAKIKGIRIDLVEDPKSPKGKDKRVVEDKNAPPLWARFYDLKTGKPFFCDRDGVPKPNLADIGYERRNGYAWYGTWPASLLEKEYPQWKKTH